MKFFWILLKVTALFCLCLVVVVAGFGFYMSLDRTDAFFVKGAQFSDFNYLYKLDEELKKEAHLRLDDGKNVYVHRLVPGQGVVYGYGWFSNSSMAIDDETFKKLTIWVADRPESYPVEFDLGHQEHVKAAYTAGGSAWPDSTCSGYFTGGSLLLEKAGSNVSVIIKGVVTPVASRFADYCGEQEVALEFLAEELSFSQLNPWLGLKGEHPYDETYR